jgi:hypothetical protein
MKRIQKQEAIEEGWIVNGNELPYLMKEGVITPKQAIALDNAHLGKTVEKLFSNLTDCFGSQVSLDRSLKTREKFAKTLNFSDNYTSLLQLRKNLKSYVSERFRNSNQISLEVTGPYIDNLAYNAGLPLAI